MDELAININNANENLNNIKTEIKQASLELKNEEIEFSKLEKQTEKDIIMHKNKINQYKSNFN